MVFHGAVIGLMIMCGYSLCRLLSYLETLNKTMQSLGLLSAIPFFTLCMISGLAINMLVLKANLGFTIDKCTIDTISNTCLEILITCAIPATDVLGGLSENVVPLIACCSSALLFLTLMVFVVAPYHFPDNPYQRGIFEFGQSSASTPMGFMLIKMLDPNCPGIVFKAIGCYVLMDGANYGLWMAIVSVTYPTGEAAGTRLLMYSSAYWLFWLVLYFVAVRPNFSRQSPINTNADGPDLAPLSTVFDDKVRGDIMAQHRLARMPTENYSK
jgi:hypothetical protein